MIDWTNKEQVDANVAGFEQATDWMWKIIADAPRCSEKRRGYFMEEQLRAESDFRHLQDQVSDDSDPATVANYHKAYSMHVVMSRLYIIERERD